MKSKPSAGNSVQKDLIQQAQEYADLGDGLAMIGCLFESMLFVALLGHFSKRYPDVNRDDIYNTIAESADKMFAAVVEGTKVRRLETYLWKIVNNKLSRLSAQSKRFSSIEEGLNEIKDPGTIPEFHKDRQDGARKKAIEIAELLLPRLGMTNVQAVMRYILQALKNGAQDISNTEIAIALGISPNNVRVWVSRGFERLSRIVRDEKLVEDSYEFPFLDEFDSYMSDTNDDDTNDSSNN